MKYALKGLQLSSILSHSSILHHLRSSPYARLRARRLACVCSSLVQLHIFHWDCSLDLSGRRDFSWLASWQQYRAWLFIVAFYRWSIIKVLTATFERIPVFVSRFPFPYFSLPELGLARRTLRFAHSVPNTF